MLIDKQGREHFKDMTRMQINEVVGKGCHKEGCHAVRQAQALSSLREVFPTNKFPLGQIATIKQ